MTSMQLFRGMTGIDPELLVQAEKISAEPWRPQKRKTIRRPFLIAALIATMLMLAGCGIAYALRLRSLKIGEYHVPLSPLTKQPRKQPPHWPWMFCPCREYRIRLIIWPDRSG